MIQVKILMGWAIYFCDNYKIMRSSTLIFRSLAIIVFLAGGAHLVTYLSASPTENSSEEHGYESISPADRNEETDYIIGKWKMVYDEGAVIYDLRKEGSAFYAYTYRYEDNEGGSESAEGSRVLTISEFDGYTGKGVYTMEYEGQHYEMECQIDMVDEATFKLSYYVFGEMDVETWRKQ